MPEVIFLAGAILMAGAFLLSPVLAIIALTRSRRIVVIEERLLVMEHRVRMLQSAALDNSQLSEYDAHATRFEPSRPPRELVPATDADTDVDTDMDTGFDTEANTKAEFENMNQAAGYPPVEAEKQEQEQEEIDRWDRRLPKSAVEPLPSRSSTVPSTVPATVPLSPEGVEAPLGGWRAASVAWEERIGGSWLNKAGALLVVIGVSLFVGWSMVHLGPVGRIAIGLALSGCLLAGGLILERNPALRVFALGLAAAGWGGLYVTTYAMHGVEAARVVDDPLTALGLLLAVATGMIVHALREGLPVMVAVAYAAAFAAVALGPPSMFAVVACIVLAGTLLAVSHHHGWGMLAVGGIVCTYGTLAFRFPPTDDIGGGWGGVGAHALIWACWVLFEAFDILTVARGRARPDAGRTLLPINLCGLLGVATLHWPPDWERFDLFLGAAAVAYGCSTFCRIVAGRRSPLPDAADTVDRVVLGGYEASITIATALWAWALWTRFETGWRLHAGLLMEAEFLFLVGIAFRQKYLRALAAAVFAVLLIRFMAVDVAAGGTTMIWGLTLARWTPSAVAVVAVLVANLVLHAPGSRQPLLTGERGYSYAATGLVAFIVGWETWQGHNGLGPQHLGLVWLAQAWLLLQLAVRFQILDAYRQSCLIGFLSIEPLGMVNAFPAFPEEVVGDSSEFWMWLPPAVALLYAAGWQLSRERLFPSVESAERDVSEMSLFAASTLLIAFLWHALPAPLVALGWGGFALLALQVGLRRPHEVLRWHAYIATGLTVGRLFLANFTNAGMTGVVSHRVLTVVPVILLLYDFAARLSDARLRRIIRPNERVVGHLCLWAATLVLVVLLRFELGRVLAVVGWAILGVVLLVMGRRRDTAELRWQSHAIALLTFARAWGTHFYVPEAPDGLLRPWVLGGLVVVSLFASEWLCPPDAAATGSSAGRGRLLGWLDDRRRSYYCVLGTVLLGVLLVHEMPASLLTAALGIEGAILLALGFVRPDRSLRLCGLAVMGICLPKLFLYDLRNLETPYRILSFVLLGMLLIAASWIYTRFKSRLHGFI